MADPNHVWVPPLNLVLMLPHKSACTSLKVMLKAALGIGDSTHRAHSLQEPLRYIWPQDIPKGAVVAGSIREPWARAVSGSKWFPRNRTDWELRVSEFESTPDDQLHVHCRPQSYDYQHVEPSIWLRVEHLQADWGTLCERMGWAPGVVHTNRSGAAILASRELDLMPYRDRILARLSDDVRLYERVTS